jgi:hypothetical protein
MHKLNNTLKRKKSFESLMCMLSQKTNKKDLNHKNTFQANASSHELLVFVIGTKNWCWFSTKLKGDYHVSQLRVRVRSTSSLFIAV